MTIPRRSAQLRLARLEGRDMMQFRHGDELYPYCDECQHGEYVPDTDILGCVEGDDPDVIEYSEQFEADPSIADTEKCPSFEPRAIVGDPGGLVTGDRRHEDGVNDAGVINDAVDLFGMMEGGKPEFAKDKDERNAVIARCLQAWKGGILASQASDSGVLDTIYDSYLDWRRNAI